MILSYIFVLLSTLFWGLSFVWTKMVFEVYGPFTVVVLRMIVSSSIIWAARAALKKNEIIQKKHWPIFLIMGFCEPFCYFLGESFGLLEVSASIAAIIIATIPVFTMMISVLLKIEKAGPVAWFGMFLSFFGMILVVYNVDSFADYTIRGLLFLSFAVLAAIGYGFAVKKLANHYNPFTIVAIHNSIGAILFLPLFLFFEYRSFINIVPPQKTVVSLICLTLFASTIAFLLYIKAIANIGLIKANVFSTLIPIHAALFSFLFLHEHFSMQKVIGMLLIVIGLICVQLNAEITKGKQYEFVNY